MNTIASDLSEQFDRAWDMLRATIGRITDEQWLAGDAPGLVPARWALHAIETVDFDMSRSPEEYTRRLDADEDGPVASLPSRSELLAYLDEVPSVSGQLFGKAGAPRVSGRGPCVQHGNPRGGE